MAIKVVRFLSLACASFALSLNVAPADTIKEAISRELSIEVGGIQTPEYKDLASREVSLFIGAEPSAPYKQIVSREVSLFIGAEPSAPYKQIVSREISLFIGVEPVPPYKQIVSREISLFIGAEPVPPYKQIVTREISVWQPSGATFIVGSGEKQVIPMLQSYEVFPAADGSRLLRASGPGSLLSFPNLTNIIGNSRRNGFLHIEALNGGRVDLSSVLTMTQPYDGAEPTVSRGIQVLADGTNSVVDLSSLVTFQDLAATPGSRLEARNGGQILLGGHGKLTLKQITILVNGPGSLVDASDPRELGAGSSGSVQALAGGRFDFSGINQITNSVVNFLADGTNSLVDLSALVYFNNGTMEARNKGRILTPRLLFLDHSTLIVSGGGQIDTTQIHRLLNSTVTLDGTMLYFLDLRNSLGTTFTYPNGGRANFPPPVDLGLANVVAGTNLLWAGDEFTVSWTGTNSSTNAILADWTDNVYLSSDGRWDIADTFLGSVDHMSGLGGNKGYSASIRAVVPGALPGDYRVIVRGDFFNQINELARETNNVTPSGPVPLAVRALPNDGTPVSGVLTTTNRAKYYALHVPSGIGLKLSLLGQRTNDANELYVSLGAIPTRQTNDLAATESSQNQRLMFTGPTGGGTYYVMVYGREINGTNAFQLVAEAASMFLVDLSPGQLGNSVPGTLVLTGAGFNETTTVEFLGAGGWTRTPASIDFIAADALRLHLDMTNWPAGLYDIRVTKGTNVAQIAGAFRVQEGGHARIETRVVTPSSLGFNIPIRQTIWIEYTNSGQVAMPAPLLTLRGDHAVRLTTDLALAIPRPGYGTIPGLSDTVNVLGLGSSRTPWLLQPGESGRIPVYYIGLAEQANYPLITFTVSVVSSDTDERIQWEPIQRLGIEGVDAAIRPVGLTDDQWSVLSANLHTLIGTTWGNYPTLLAENMSYLDNIGRPTTELSKLWGFLIRQASGRLCPLRSLHSSVDAAAPAPGFPLVFQRVYNQSLLSRVRLGALGRGWGHNWEISVENPTNGQAVIRVPAGADRWFTQNSDGSYKPSANSSGEYGRLVFTNGAFHLTEVDQTVLQFRADGLLDYVCDSNSNRVNVAYASGRITAITHSSGRQLLLEYNANGRLTRLTDPVGPGSADDSVTTYEYDNSWEYGAPGEHLVTVTQPGSRITRYTYQAAAGAARHALLSVTHPDNRSDSFAYDTQGRLIQASRSLGGADSQELTFHYDPCGKVTVRDGVGQQVALSYGFDGQLAQARDGENRVLRLGYNANAEVVRATLPGGYQYRFERGTNGLMTAVEDPLHAVNRFDYDPAFSALTRFTDARANALEYPRDSRGNATAAIYADGSRELFSVDPHGDVLNYTNRRGQVISFTRNSAGQITSKDFKTTAGVDFRYEYDIAGRLLRAIDANGTNSMTYDTNTHRLTRIEYPGGRWFTFDYDASGRRVARKGHDGYMLGYVYDDVGRLARMTNGSAQVLVRYEYDAGGRVVRKTLSNGVMTTNAYNNAGQVLSVVNLKPDGSMLSRYDYAYDAAGRPSSMRTRRGYAGLAADETQTYGYDDLGQLTRVEYSIGRIVEYQYDTMGNRLRVIDSGVEATYAANTLNQYLAAGAAIYLYDADGNLTNRNEGGLTTVFRYDPQNRLVGVVTPTNTVTYTYDALGNRVGVDSTLDGKKSYLTDPIGLENVVGEYSASGQLLARYDHGLGLLDREDVSGQRATYTFSGIGHTSELTDPSVAVLNGYSHSPWGDSLGEFGTIPNPFTFVGEDGVSREEAGFFLMRHRAYDQVTGRFVQPDPVRLAGGLNLYAYVRNAPVAHVDPAGLFAGMPMRGGGGQNGDGTGLTLNGDTNTGDNNSDNGNDMTWFDYVVDFLNFFHLPSHGGEPRDEREGVASCGAGRYNPRNPGDPSGPVGPDAPNDPDDGGSSDVVGSFDPNDKIGPSGTAEGRFVQLGDILMYQVRFENKSDATSPARQVVVTDVLDPNLDLDTLEWFEIGFGGHQVAIPAGLDSYSGTESIVAAGTPILVDVQAGLDYATRTLSVTLTALDPLTGWYPEDPLIGLLYPNDSTGRGEGSISYFVSARAGTPTGTVITNQARIVFDYNEPIDTPVVFNTLDSGAPSSQVQGLPAVNSRAFPLKWSGTDDSGGVGVDSYDLYVSTDGGEFVRTLVHATGTNTWFQGTPGHSYAFYTVAWDWVGNQELPPTTADAFTTVPTNAPVLAAAAGYVVFPGTPVVFTNAVVMGSPVGEWRFTLDAGAPAGASVNPTDGVFRWTPDCSQASSTNLITVRVTDSGWTNMVDAVSFTVVVGECVQPTIGRQVLLAGQSGRVPVWLVSSVPLTNLQMNLVSPADRLTNYTLQTLVPEICGSAIIPSPGGRYGVSLAACSGQWLIGTQQVAWLNFMTVSNQSSAFVQLLLTNLQGNMLSGAPVANFAPQAGRIVVVGPEPLLEMTRATNAEPALILYGQPGSAYAIHHRTGTESGAWQPVLTNLTIGTNLFLQFAPLPGVTNVNFYRASRP